MITTPVEVHDEFFELHPLRAIWWPKHSMVICAVVHIGKAAHFRAAGIPIPTEVNAANLSNLLSVLQQFNPKSLLFLGDLFHSWSNNEWVDLTDCLAQFKGLETLLIRGNHEVEQSRMYETMGFTVYESLLVDAILFTHEPLAKQPEGIFNLCGHIHPAIQLKGVARQRLRLPCFHFGPRQGILPAFGEFTGTHTIQPKRGDRVFVVAENRVIPVE